MKWFDPIGSHLLISTLLSSNILYCGIDCTCIQGLSSHRYKRAPRRDRMWRVIKTYTSSKRTTRPANSHRSESSGYTQRNVNSLVSLLLLQLLSLVGSLWVDYSWIVLDNGWAFLNKCWFVCLVAGSNAKDFLMPSYLIKNNNSINQDILLSMIQYVFAWLDQSIDLNSIETPFFSVKND
jgi:hypothetical protein